jgi:uncharacterized phiE125 gp8 family phage protein
MMLIEEDAIPTEALPLAAFKAHLRLGTGFDETALQDEVLESFLRAACAAVEARTGKVLIARAFTLTLARWRGGDGQAFPVAPVRSVEAVTLVAPDGQETALAAAEIRIEQDTHRPRLRAVRGALPGVPTGGEVRVAFTAGFAAGWDGVPADLAQAVLLLASHYYEYRHETQLSDGCMPFGVSSLIQRYKPLRLHLGYGA